MIKQINQYLRSERVTRNTEERHDNEFERNQNNIVTFLRTMQTMQANIDLFVSLGRSDAAFEARVKLADMEYRLLSRLNKLNSSSCKISTPISYLSFDELIELNKRSNNEIRH